MLFEDEKDNIKNSADISIQEDGTVTWEDVLSNDDDLVIIDDPAEKKPKATSSSIDLGDELELVQSPDDDIDDQELMQILNNSESASEEKAQAQAQAQEETSIDSQLADVIIDDNEEELTPRKTKVAKSSSGLLPVLLSILVAVAVGGGVYYYTQFYTDNENLGQENIAPPQTPQQEMNNINQEALEQRKQEENIPVVHEEQSEEVQPEVKEEEKKAEEKKEEKKQVIVVTPTGRSNPFLPIAKYVSATIPQANVDYDKAGIPKPPETYGAQNETSKLMSIAVSGIMYDDIKPSAIITFDSNDYFVQKGDRLDDYKVIDITRTYVTLAHNNNIYKASIGEEFKVSTQFYGNAQFLPEQQGGGRQYYSIGAQERTMGVEKRLRYTSEEDITINAR